METQEAHESSEEIHEKAEQYDAQMTANLSDFQAGKISRAQFSRRLELLISQPKSLDVRSRYLEIQKERFS